MLKLKAQPKPPPPPSWWPQLETMLGFSPRQSKLFWAAISASKDPTIIALRFRCDAYDKQPYRTLVEDHDQRTRFLQQTWTLHRLCMSLEVLHKEGLLSRQDCSKLEEKFLLRANADGLWLRRHR